MGGLHDVSDQVPQIVDHGIDAFRKLADFILGMDVGLLAQIPFGNLADKSNNMIQRFGNQAGDHITEENADNKCNEHQANGNIPRFGEGLF
ncbi:hypothetical protein D3C75_934080 [compost metagenome]